MRERLLALLEEGCTCALAHGEKILTSTQRGVVPLLAWLESGENYQGGVVADKVVGKTAAYLYVLLGVASVHAKVISKAAEEVFQCFHLPYTYERSVEAIRNRTGDGFCPMERAVWGLDDPQTAYEKIVQTRKELLK